MLRFRDFGVFVFDLGCFAFEFWMLHFRSRVLRFRSRVLRFRVLGASFSRFRGLHFRSRVLYFEIWVLHFRDLGASCFGLRFRVLRFRDYPKSSEITNKQITIKSLQHESKQSNEELKTKVKLKKQGLTKTFKSKQNHLRPRENVEMQVLCSGQMASKAHQLPRL